MHANANTEGTTASSSPLYVSTAGLGPGVELNTFLAATILQLAAEIAIVLPRMLP